MSFFAASRVSARKPNPSSLCSAGHLEQFLHLGRPQVARQAEPREIDKAAFETQQLRHHFGVGFDERREFQQAPLGAPVTRRTERIDRRRSGHRAGGRRIAQDHPVAGQRTHLLVEDDLRQPGVARRQPLAFEQRHAAHDMGRSQMHMHRRPVLQRLRLGREQAQTERRC